MEKHQAASQFNAYVKKLGLTEKSVHEKYLGTIFTKQQTGFNPDTQTLLQKGARLADIKINDDPNLTLLCGYNDFDPFIKFGRDNQLFIKREYIDKLKEETRYSEDQLKKLKNLYVTYAELGKGLNFYRFKQFLASIFNIENHPFSEDFFLFFDTNRDGLVDFYEMVIGMDILENGTFEDKCKFCFAMYDILENGALDIYTLREVLKKAYVNQIVSLETAMQRLRDFKTSNPDGWLWDEFEEQILPLIDSALPLALDRMEFHRSLINELEFKYNFTLESLEHLWNMYRPTLDKGVSDNRVKTAMAFAAHSPELVTKEQYKLIMFDVFKVKDAQLVNNVFIIADNNGNGALDIRELIGNIAFWLRGTLGYKWALFFEVFRSVNGGIYVSKENIIKILQDAVKVFKETFFNAKTTADKMNTTQNGMITFEEFKEYCKFNPQAIDFLCRLTIGPYPLSVELQQKLMEYQQAQMMHYYPTLMLSQSVNHPELPSSAPIKEAIEVQLGKNRSQSKSIFHTPSKPTTPLMLQSAAQVAQNPHSFQIVPIEDKRKGGQQSRLNFAGVGQQQIFNHIRSSHTPDKVGGTPINPHKRWLAREQ